MASQTSTDLPAATEEQAASQTEAAAADDGSEAALAASITEPTADAKSQPPPAAPAATASAEAASSPLASSTSTSTSASVPPESASATTAISPTDPAPSSASTASAASPSPSSPPPAQPDSPILHVMLVGFHHTYGPQVEYMYPPLPGQPAPPAPGDDSTKGLTLPAEWEHLPFLALPDGLHHHHVDSTLFHLPSLDPARPGILFGVSCAQQIASSELVKAGADVTRNTVLKSICVLCTKPLYMVVREQLSLATTALFHQKDFTERSLLQALYHSLSRSVASSAASADDAYLHSGLNLRRLVNRLRHKILQVYKLLFLERRVVIFSSSAQDPASEICTAVISLVSLMPGMLTRGLDPPPAADSLASAPAPAPATDVPLHKRIEAHRQRPLAERLALAGCPLRWFGDNGLCHPYATLQQLDALQAARSFVAGATNSMLTSHKPFADVTVDISEKALIEIRDVSIKAPITLHTADLRFADMICKTVAETGDPEAPDLEPSGYVGSSDWIRTQFASYTLSLLTTADNAINIPSATNQAELNEFCTPFVESWRQTHHYRAWARAMHERTLQQHLRLCHAEEVGHHFKGSLKMSDLSLRVSHTLSDTGLGQRSREERSAKIRSSLSTSGKAVESAVSDGGKAIASVFSSVKSGLTKFWQSFEPPAGGRVSPSGRVSPGGRASPSAAAAVATSDTAAAGGSAPAAPTPGPAETQGDEEEPAPPAEPAEAKTED